MPCRVCSPSLPLHTFGDYSFAGRTNAQCPGKPAHALAVCGWACTVDASGTFTPADRTPQAQGHTLNSTRLILRGNKNKVLVIAPWALRRCFGVVLQR